MHQDFDCLLWFFDSVFDGCLNYWSFVPSFGWLKLDFLGLRRVGFSALRALMTRASPANQNYGTKLQYCAPPSLEQNRKTNSWQSKLICRLHCFFLVFFTNSSMSGTYFKYPFHIQTFAPLTSFGSPHSPASRDGS